MKSKIFSEVPFTGTYKKESPDGVTYMDQGKLPLFPPTIDLEYTFEFCRLLVSTYFHHHINEIRASSNWRSPEKYFFDQRMDELYSRVISDLEQAKKKLLQDHHIIDQYPRIATESIFERSSFNRGAIIDLDSKIQSSPDLEQKLEEAFGIQDKTTSEISRKIRLKNRVTVEIDDSNIPFGDITLLVPFKITKEIYEQVRDFLFAQLKSKNPRIDTTNPLVYNCAWRFQHEQGHYLIAKVFEKDIEQLPKQNYT